MLFEIVKEADTIATIRLVGPLVHTDTVNPLNQLMRRLADRGIRGVALNCDKVQRVNASGLAGFADLLLRDHPVQVAVFSLTEKLINALNKRDMLYALPIFETEDDVRNSPDFQRIQLGHTRAVLLCAGAGSRIAPLSQMVPKPMLDILGKPVLAHILDHLDRFGLRSVLLNPGHLAPKIHDYFQANPRGNQTLFFCNEGRQQGTEWHPQALGSASTLQRMQRDHSAFDRDFFVLCGDALVDFDMTAAMQAHRATSADITIVAQHVPESETHKYGIIETATGTRITGFQEKPSPGTATSNLANTGIYIFKPAVLDLLPEKIGQDIASDLIPHVIAAGGAVHVHAPQFSWVDIGCGRDYFNALEAVFAGKVEHLRPQGTEIRPGVWCDDSAWVSQRATIHGPCYFGPHAEVQAGAYIEGPVSVGEGSIISGSSAVRHSILMPETLVERSAIIDGQITQADWSISHALADGRAQKALPMPNVSAAKRVVTERISLTA
ncbi:MAG: sugar phosphate nucleotidyltransferase [Pseudomonadota bacterium]